MRRFHATEKHVRTFKLTKKEVEQLTSKLPELERELEAIEKYVLSPRRLAEYEAKVAAGNAPPIHPSQVVSNWLDNPEWDAKRNEVEYVKELLRTGKETRYID